MDEYEKYLEKHIADMKNYPEENSGRSMLKMALHEYRAFKAKAVEATAEGSLKESLAKYDNAKGR
jgi:hypothetical protein